jgi:thiol-disulfide isomerase/thioredoxin
MLHALITAAAALACVLQPAYDAGGEDMLGALTREDILRALPDWQEVVSAYRPDAGTVDRLKTLDSPVEVNVFLGTWCPDSKAHVSEFFKVLDAVDNPLLVASYVGVPRDKTLRAEYYQGWNIERLPTFLVLVGGREIGRIIEIPKVSIERDLADILGR